MKKHLLKGLLKNRTPYALVIKIVFVILTAYSIIQLSNEAKQMEENAHISGLLNTGDFIEKYVSDKYSYNWNKLGNHCRRTDPYSGVYELRISRDEKTVNAWVSKSELYLTNEEGKVDYMGFAFPQDSIYVVMFLDYNESVRIWIAYGGDYHIEVASFADEDNPIYYSIPFEDGMYIPNIEMEQLGIPTDEIVALAEDTRQLFEEEMLKMHHYQIDKAKRNRGRLANAGILFFVVYAFILWDKVKRKVKLQGKPAEVCLGEVLANTGAKILRGKYELLGMGSVFWIYILKPIISEFLLFPLEGQIKNLVAYGISAVLVVLLCVLLFFKGSLNGREPLSIGLCFIRIFRTFLGIVIAVSLINLGVGLVSDFYPHSWQFYVINYMAASITTGILCIWGQIKRRREEDVR